MLQHNNEKLSMLILLALSAFVHLSLLKLPLGVQASHAVPVISVKLCQLARDVNGGDRHKPSKLSQSSGKTAVQRGKGYQSSTSVRAQIAPLSVSNTASPIEHSNAAQSFDGAQPVACASAAGSANPGGGEPRAEIAFGAGDGPRFRSQILPEYPRRARLAGVEGLVILRLTINANGDLAQIEVVQSGTHGFTEAAIRSVRASTYYPAVREGSPVEASVLLPIRFRLQF